MSATSVKLLQAAAEIVGGTRALSDCLGVRETLLARYLADSAELPDWLLLRAVDIILADRQLGVPPGGERISPDSSSASTGAI